jgi:uncharacterized Zn finger protein
MKIKCPGCGSGASQVLIGSDDHYYAKCLECGEITPIESSVTPMPETEKEKPATIGRASHR